MITATPIKASNGATFTETAMIGLPSDYDENGEPVRLIIDCHGYSATINPNENYYNKYNWAKTLVHDGYAVLGAVEHAYHIYFIHTCQPRQI